MLDALESGLAGKTFTADALLTQTKLAERLLQCAVTVKSTGTRTVELAYGITSHAPDTAAAERLLALNRGHWTAEAVHHILDTAWDEDRCRIRTGYGPENTTRLRRFAIGIIRAHSKCVAPTVRKLNRNPRLVFDYLKMTANTLNHSKLATSSARTN